MKNRMAKKRSCLALAGTIAYVLTASLKVAVAGLF
jgi:hypothetical protein